MSEFNQNLWAPWRMEYIRSLIEDQKESGCFLCRYDRERHRDRENHVIWRGQSAYVVMNRFPYTNGHLLIAHIRHKGALTDLDEQELLEMTRMTRDAVAMLGSVVKAQGFNIGFNVGLCAGAGLPDHLHVHVVPRWSGDTNFMSVVGDIRVVPDSLDVLYGELAEYADKAGWRAT